MLTDYVFRTDPVLGLPFVLCMVQIAFQSVSPVTVMYSAIRRQNSTERLVLSLFPLVFFVTYSFMDVFLGGSFLGGGFRYQEQLLSYLLYSNVRIEIVAVLLLFPITFFAVARWTGPRLLSMIGGLITWGLFLFSALASGALFFWGADGFIWGTFAQQLVTWYVYSIYAVLFQDVLNLTALVWHVLFSERPFKGDLDTLLYDSAWCEKQVRRLLLSGYRVALCATLPLLLLLYALLVPSMTEGPSALSTLLSLQLILLVPEGVLAMFAIHLLFPITIPAIRQVKQWKNTHQLQRQFCQEYFRTSAPLVRGSRLELTPHFLLIRAMPKPALCYLPSVQDIIPGAGQTRLQCKDGSRISLGPLTNRDQVLLEQALKKVCKEAQENDGRFPDPHPSFGWR